MNTENQDLSSENNFSDPSESPDLTSLVCDTCFGDNLLKCVGIQKCLRCEKAFCIHLASKADPCHFCVNCFSDLKVTISDPEVQVIEHYNPATNQTVRFERHPRGRRIKLEGGGYFFAQRMIEQMNDAEREMFIEHHRAMLGLLLNENEIKRAEKAHKAAGVKTPSTTLSSPAAVPVVKTTVTRTTRTTVSKQDKAREQAKAALFAMYKGVLSMEQIDQMLNAQMPIAKTKP